MSDRTDYLEIAAARSQRVRAALNAMRPGMPAGRLEELLGTVYEDHALIVMNRVDPQGAFVYTQPYVVWGAHVMSDDLSQEALQKNRFGATTAQIFTDYLTLQSGANGLVDRFRREDTADFVDACYALAKQICDPPALSE